MRSMKQGSLLFCSAVVFGILLAATLMMTLTAYFFRRHSVSQAAWIVILAVGAVLLALAVFLFWWVIYRPLKKLEGVLTRLEAVGGKEPVNLWGSAERMAENINLLLEELTQSIEREHAEAMLRQQFQYAELQNQINPHFLYNTLETIRGQAIIDDNYKVADMTETLARYFRYNISKNKDDVTLEQELENIKNYIKIHQYRFPERFQFRIFPHVEREAYANCMIPKMTLQPLVENAIFHGLEQKLEQGKIQIHIDATADKLIVIVSDDGVGMAPERLEEMNRKLRSAEGHVELTSSGQHNGIAMANVNSRLKMLYGEGCGLCVTSTLGLGTEVEITLPRITTDKREGQL